MDLLRIALLCLCAGVIVWYSVAIFLIGACTAGNIAAGRPFSFTVTKHAAMIWLSTVGIIGAFAL